MTGGPVPGSSSSAAGAGAHRCSVYGGAGRHRVHGWPTSRPGTGVETADDRKRDGCPPAPEAAKGDENKARHLVRPRHGLAFGAPGLHLGGRRRQGPDGQWLDRAMFGYFGAKWPPSTSIADSGMPWTTLRATQFFDLMLPTARDSCPGCPWSRYSPASSFQPVDAGEVDERLVEPRSAHLPDLCPTRRAADSTRDARARRQLPPGRRQAPTRPISMPVPARRPSEIRDGMNLTPERAVGRGPGKSSSPSVSAPRARRAPPWPDPRRGHEATSRACARTAAGPRRRPPARSRRTSHGEHRRRRSAVPSSRPRSVSMIGVNGWFSANQRSRPGIDSVGTNAAAQERQEHQEHRQVARGLDALGHHAERDRQPA